MITCSNYLYLHASPRGCSAMVSMAGAELCDVMRGTVSSGRWSAVGDRY